MTPAYWIPALVGARMKREGKFHVYLNAILVNHTDVILAEGGNPEWWQNAKAVSSTPSHNSWLSAP